MRTAFKIELSSSIFFVSNVSSIIAILSLPVFALIPTIFALAVDKAFVISASNPLLSFAEISISTL